MNSRLVRVCASCGKLTEVGQPILWFTLWGAGIARHAVCEATPAYLARIADAKAQEAERRERDLQRWARKGQGPDA